MFWDGELREIFPMHTTCSVLQEFSVVFCLYTCVAARPSAMKSPFTCLHLKVLPFALRTVILNKSHFSSSLSPALTTLAFFFLKPLYPGSWSPLRSPVALAFCPSLPEHSSQSRHVKNGSQTSQDPCGSSAGLSCP